MHRTLVRVVNDSRQGWLELALGIRPKGQGVPTRVIAAAKALFDRRFPEASQTGREPDAMDLTIRTGEVGPGET